MELGLKAVGFQSIQDIDGRKSFVKDTRHNLSVILSIIEEKAFFNKTRRRNGMVKRVFF